MTLVDRFRSHAATQPETLVYTFLDDGGAVVASLTRGELDARARVVASELVTRGLRGQRVLLLYGPGLEFIEAFFGCLYAGVACVPAYPPE
ncbi:MAG TPA: AMP-binding protein, partial [Labilithrix sp.]|nr:AMP-binding protein [Labilithrix sp.]